jgi:Spy/CpxP family protein refolding chaperone
MKKLIIALFALGSFAGAASAQETAGEPRHKHHHGYQAAMKELNLSDSQRQQVKTIIDSSRRQLKALDGNEGITLKEFRERRSALKKAQRQQIENLLTPEQKSQLAKSKAERSQRRGQLLSKGLDSLKAKLDLTDEQVSKIRAGHEALRAKAKLIRENTQLSQSEKKEQLTALRKEQKATLQQVLTPGQAEKMEQIRKERMDRHSRK